MMVSHKINPRLHWLWLYVAINITATLIMLDSGQLIGDLDGFPIHSIKNLLLALFLVVSTYLIILGPVFNFLFKIKIQSIKYGVNEATLGKKIGIVILILQLLFIVFNISNDVNIAGSNNTKTDSVFSILWVLIPIDLLFFIYYGVYRENKCFYPNLIIWLLSNTLRGWGGVFFIVMFLEWCRAAYNNKLFTKKLFIIVPIALLLYPLLVNLKWIIRASGAKNLQIQDLAESFAKNIEIVEYLNLISNGITHVIGRLQTTSTLSDVIKNGNFLESKYLNGDFAPFWKEGLHGIMFDRLFSGEKQRLIGVAYTEYIDFGFSYEVGDWNISLGYPSWFFMSPNLIPVYFLYTLFLGFLSIYLLRKIGFSLVSRDMIWFSWLVYLLAPWFQTFTMFIYALFLFVILKFFLSRLPSFLIIKRTN